MNAPIVGRRFITGYASLAWLLIIACRSTSSPELEPATPSTPATPVTAEPESTPPVAAGPDEPASENDPEAPAAAVESSPPALPPADPTPADGWPESIPWISDPQLYDASFETSEAGDLRVYWSVPLDAAPDLRARLRPRLAELGLTVDDACTLEAEGRCPIRHAKRRGFVYYDTPVDAEERTGVVLHWLPAGHSPPRRLPGPCVKPPQRERHFELFSDGVNGSGELFRSNWKDSVKTAEGPDLDGDGVGEIFVPHTDKGGCPWEVPQEVYVMRGACGHRIGSVRGEVQYDSESTPFVRGLRTVQTYAHWVDRAGLLYQDPPVSHDWSRRYTFDGKKLRKVAEDRSDGVCHHCGTMECVPIKKSP